MFGIDFLGNDKLIMFICNHCSFVVHCHDQISIQYQSDIECIIISSNDIELYHEDSPNKIKDLANKLGWNFPYLYDDSREVVQNFNIKSTSEFFLFNKNNILQYKDRMNDSTSSNNKMQTVAD